MVESSNPIKNVELEEIVDKERYNKVKRKNEKRKKCHTKLQVI